MILKSYNADVLVRNSINLYGISGIILSLLVIFFLIILEPTYSLKNILSGIFYFLFTSFLSFNNYFKRNPFAISFCVVTILFFNLPLAYILTQGSEYIIGSKYHAYLSNNVIVSSLPYSQSQYHESMSNALLFLTACWVSVWTALVFSAKKASDILITDKIFTKLKLWLIIVSTVGIFLFHINQHQEYITALQLKQQLDQSKLAVLFSMQGFLHLMALVFFLKMNNIQSQKERKSEKYIAGSIFILIVIYQTYAGSKAAILQISATFFLAPIVLSGLYHKSRVYFFSLSSLLLIFLLSPIVFYIVNNYRISGSSSYYVSATSINFSLVEFMNVFTKIFYRLGQSGIDMYLLIYKSFIGVHYDLKLSGDLITYILKNSVNLTLPGTPFPEAFAPSGQFFDEVINHSLIAWDRGRDPLHFSINMNTSAYTFYGESIIFFGIMAPIAIFSIIYSYVRVFYWTKNMLIKLVLVTAFYQGFISYGLDGTIGDSFNILLSVFVLFFCFKILSTRIKI